MTNGEPFDTPGQCGPAWWRNPLWWRSYWPLAAVAAVFAIWIALSLLPKPIVCPGCKDPTRPLSYTCGEAHNPGPFFLDGRVNHYGTGYIGCSL